MLNSLSDEERYADKPDEKRLVELGKENRKGGAVLYISHDAWFETLDAATTAQLVAPPLPVCAFGGP